MSEKIFLNVPYDKKEYVKSLGGRWSPTDKKWYCYDDKKILIDEFSKPISKPKKIYLDVPYDNKNDVKEHGCRYDIDIKKWFIYDNNQHLDYILSNYDEYIE